MILLQSELAHAAEYASSADRSNTAKTSRPNDGGGSYHHRRHQLLNDIGKQMTRWQAAAAAKSSPCMESSLATFIY